MQGKFLKVSSLALLQIVIVGNLQTLPANAVFGFALPFLYVLASLMFFVPCVLMVAELATTRPQTGGAYIWCEQAFGAKVGFFTVAILWISNLLWYPSIFSLLAMNLAYLINPDWAQYKTYVVSFALILFWCITLLNCFGVKFSSRVSVMSSVLGIIFPMLVIIISGIVWWFSGHPLATTLHTTPWVPNLLHFDNLGYLIAIVISLFGIEIAAVHAGNVVNPKHDFPRSLFISAALLVLLLLGSEMAISWLIPVAKLSVITGLLDALKMFFQALHLSALLLLMLFLVFVGNIGSITAWMLGSTRGMFVACQNNHVSKLLQKTNRYQAPFGILIAEAIIFTLACGVFLIFPHITDSFWLLLDLASQITLIYYIILFCAAIRLRYKPVLIDGFVIPGGKIILWSLMCLGVLTSLLALMLGFIAPPGLRAADIHNFHAVLGLGLLFAGVLPVLLLFSARYFGAILLLKKK